MIFFSSGCEKAGDCMLLKERQKFGFDLINGKHIGGGSGGGGCGGGIVQKCKCENLV